MVELHHLLNLRRNASKEEVRKAYQRRLYALHPTNKKTGSSASFMELQEAYKNYVLGDSFLNCFSIVPNNIGSFPCRCGSVYNVEIETVGRMECVSCSCFIEIEKPVECIEGDNKDSR